MLKKERERLEYLIKLKKASIEQMEQRLKVGRELKKKYNYRDLKLTTELSETVFEVVKAVTFVKKVQIIEKCSYKKIADARKIAIYLLYQQGYGLSAIGNLLKRDHSTIKFHTNNIDNLEKYDPEIAKKLAVCNELLSEKLKKVSE